MQAFEESRLIEKARRGSDAAFTELMRAYQDRLYRFLLARAARAEDAEDALQESFVNAYRYLDSYNSRWQFSTWLYRIALRELGKIAGKAPQAEEARDIAVNDEDPLEQCIRADDRDNLWRLAREHLSESSYTTMWLRYAEDMQVREVARVMARPQTWVKVVLHRARKKLTACVEAPQSNRKAPAKDTGKELKQESTSLKAGMML